MAHARTKNAIQLGSLLKTCCLTPLKNSRNMHMDTLSLLFYASTFCAAVKKAFTPLVTVVRLKLISPATFPKMVAI